MEKETKDGKRKFVEVDEMVANKVQLLCFLKRTTIKDFVTKTLKKEMQPYQAWLENIKKLQADSPGHFG